MGMVTIQTHGSFGNTNEVFSAMEGGHAYALSRAIAHLTAEMENAIRLDHKLQDEGQRPPLSDFGQLPK